MGQEPDSDSQALLARSPTLFRRAWPTRGLADAVSAIDPTALYEEYLALRAAAPQRPLTGKQFFVGHAGRAGGAAASNRLEEHLAIALLNLGRRWACAGGGWFRLLDYQVPLKARQADTRIGKIDLLGVTDQGRLVVVELKVESARGGRGDAPPAALMEGLRYAAIVEANLEGIADEAERRFGVTVARLPPIVLLLAPQTWWRHWLTLPAAGPWAPGLARLAAAFEARSGLSIESLALENVAVVLGHQEHPPRLAQVPSLHPVDLAAPSAIGRALSLTAGGDEGRAYLDSLCERLWDWAIPRHVQQLDGDPRPGRPPVLKAAFAAENVLVPAGESRAEEIRACISPQQRHRHFASLRSSQALAQSVFGAIKAFRRLDLLEGITAECGRPAFFTDHRSWALELEHEVATLGEPRPTSIDVLLSSPARCVAVECKFSESEFGTCSRPRLKPGDEGFPAQHCDGTYRAQAGRRERCALTSIGVQYWDYLPSLFDWPKARDHVPCPFGSVYQLARNVLAAAVTVDGTVDPSRGHALVLYDARNPAFQAGGRADLQWEAANAACLVPGAMRRVSWQRVLRFFAAAPDLAWLCDGLQRKYGLAPD